MITILAFVVFIFLIVSNRSLSSRLNVIESKLKNGASVNATSMGRKPESVNVAQTASFVASLKDESPVAASSADRNPVSQVEAPNKFTNWLKEDWLMKLGAFLFIVGFGWFVSYAFANNWIGPVGRISIGICSGALIMVFGFWRMMKYPSQGGFFMALGAGMAMLTIFAGMSLYHFFTPTSAVAFDFIIIAFVAFASYKFNIKSLAYVAQILGFVTPLLVTGLTDSIFLFSYLFFVSLATLFLASVTGWRDLIASSLIFVGMYSLPYLTAGNFGGGRYVVDAPIILNFAYLFSTMYLVAGMFAVIRKGVQNIKNEIFLATLNGLFLFMWIYNVAPKEWSVMLFAFWAVIFTISSFTAFKFSSNLAPFYAYGSVAVAFIGAATAEQLSGATLTIAFTIEVLLLVMSVLLLTKNTKSASVVSWLFIVPFILSLSNIAKYANSRYLFSEDFTVLIVIIIALILAGRVIIWTALSQKQTEDPKEVNAGSILVVFGILYLGYTFWHFIHILMKETPDLATMTTLIIYTIFGLVAYFSGLYGNDIARKTYGIVLLAFVVLRLMIVDVWQMELFGRVITFLAIGVLLMSTAFLTKRKKNG